MRDVSMLERVALRDHEAMEEIRKTYGETVQRIAESVLGVQRRSQVPEVVEAVWIDLWSHAHLYDMERADSAGWIRKTARDAALAYVRRQGVASSAPDPAALDARRDQEIREELGELSTKGARIGPAVNPPVPALCDALRLLPSADRGILLRRYAYWENLDRMAEVSGTTREAVADRLRLARTRLAAIWPPKVEGAPPDAVVASAWEVLDPDLLSDCVPDAPLPYGVDANSTSAASGGGFGKAFHASGNRRFRPWVIAAAILVTIAVFFIGLGLSPKILKDLWPEPLAIPTGPGAIYVPPDALVDPIGRNASLMDMVYFKWSRISSVAVVRNGSNSLRKSRTLREPEDIDRLYSLLTASSYIFSNYTKDQNPAYYELQINAEGFHSLLFYAGADGMLVVSGNFSSELGSLGNHVVLKSLDTSFAKFSQEMDTLTALFG